MIELFAHKQIRCNYCGFGFSFTGFGSAAKMVCPACGEENEIEQTEEKQQRADNEQQTAGQQTAGQQTAQSREPATDGGQRGANVFRIDEEKPGASATVPCSVEHCPLLTGGESGEAVAEQLGLKLRKKQSRKYTLLAWTVTLQMCILIGIFLFIAQTEIIRERNRASAPVMVPASHTTHFPMALREAEAEPVPRIQTLLMPEPLTPPPAEPENPHIRDNGENGLPDNLLFAASDAEYALFPSVFSHADLEHDAYSLPLLPPGGWEMEPFIDDDTPPLPPPAEQRKLTLEMVDELMERAKEIQAIDPEESAEHLLKAAKICAHLGQPLPDAMYWMLGNVFASMTWGEPLLEAAPAVETMALSPNSRYFIVQLHDKTVWFWDLHNAEQQGVPLDSGTEEYVKFLFTPDLRWIIGGQKDGTIRIWDRSLNNPAEAVITLPERIPGLQDLQIAPNGQWLAAFGHAPNGMMIAQNNSSIQPVHPLNYQRGDQWGTPEGPHPVLLWNLRQMSSGLIPMALGIPSMPQPVQVIQFSPNSDRIAVGRRDTVVRVYDLTARGIVEEPFVLRGHQLGITRIAFAPNGQWLATGSQDNTVRLWNLASSKVSTESVVLYGHVGWISALTITPSGEQVISGSYDGTVRIWNVKEGQIGTALDEVPVVFESNLGVLESLLITQNGNKMVALGKEGCLGIYSFPSLMGGKNSENFQGITFRNSELLISKCLITSDDLLLIFSYEHLADPVNSGIRLWPLCPQAFVQ